MAVHWLTLAEAARTALTAATMWHGTGRRCDTPLSHSEGMVETVERNYDTDAAVHELQQLQWRLRRVCGPQHAADPRELSSDDPAAQRRPSASATW